MSTFKQISIQILDETTCEFCGNKAQKSKLIYKVKYQVKRTIINPDIPEGLYERGDPWFREYYCPCCTAIVVKEYINA